MRVCKPELRNVNHFSGWPSTFAQVAEMQPINTPAQFLETEIADLKLGLAAGYSSYAEGWVRYAEAMSEEVGILTTWLHDWNFQIFATRKRLNASYTKDPKYHPSMYL